MTKQSLKDEVQHLLERTGLGPVDEMTLARLAKAVQTEGPEDRMRAILDALGMPGVPEEALARFVEVARNADGMTDAEIADAIMVPPCPFCGSEDTHACEETPGIEDPTVALCYDCKRYFCSECESELTREDPTCTNPDCWLNQDDEDDEDDEELEPEL